MRRDSPEQADCERLAEHLPFLTRLEFGCRDYDYLYDKCGVGDLQCILRHPASEIHSLTELTLNMDMYDDALGLVIDSFPALKRLHIWGLDPSEDYSSSQWGLEWFRVEYWGRKDRADSRVGQDMGADDLRTLARMPQPSGECVVLSVAGSLCLTADEKVSPQWVVKYEKQSITWMVDTQGTSLTRTPLQAWKARSVASIGWTIPPLAFGVNHANEHMHGCLVLVWCDAQGWLGDGAELSQSDAESDSGYETGDTSSEDEKDDVS